ncbi:hypothetical protein BDM02DRAFT_3131943 [Thelephora ganbajun]|uniref:Uncharacterized protein n=1 Tax=Thelephora ganbajun TaxID=370292 RepID=A0ACB6Z465_THEGA|nr:hypothetical protein BDM02DRAFT_3131943 [Thelephora ganbajun]
MSQDSPRELELPWSDGDSKFWPPTAGSSKSHECYVPTAPGDDASIQWRLKLGTGLAKHLRLSGTTGRKGICCSFIVKGIVGISTSMAEFKSFLSQAGKTFDIAQPLNSCCMLCGFGKTPIRRVPLHLASGTIHSYSLKDTTDDSPHRARRSSLVADSHSILACVRVAAPIVAPSADVNLHLASAWPILHELVWCKLRQPIARVEILVDFWPGLIKEGTNGSNEYLVTLIGITHNVSISLDVMVPYRAYQMGENLIRGIQRCCRGETRIRLFNLDRYLRTEMDDNRFAVVSAAFLFAIAFSEHLATVWSWTSKSNIDDPRSRRSKEEKYDVLWWGPECIERRQLVQLKMPRDAISIGEDASAAPPLTGNCPAGLERPAFLQIHSISYWPKSQRTGGSVTGPVVVGMVFELADEHQYDQGRYQDLPPPPDGKVFRPLLKEGYEIVLPVTVLCGRYYCELDPSNTLNDNSAPNVRLKSLVGTGSVKRSSITPTTFCATRAKMVEHAYGKGRSSALQRSQQLPWYRSPLASSTGNDDPTRNIIINYSKKEKKRCLWVSGQETANSLQSEPTVYREKNIRIEGQEIRGLSKRAFEYSLQCARRNWVAVFLMAPARPLTVNPAISHARYMPSVMRIRLLQKGDLGLCLLWSTGRRFQLQIACGAWVMRQRALHQQQVGELVAQAQASPSFIDLLDSDCLALVFRAVKSSFPDTTTPSLRQIHDRNCELVGLRRVRREWRYLIDSDPYLWNSVVIVMGDRASMESASMFLHYSRTTAIYLYGHGGSLRLNRYTRKLAHGLKRELQTASDRIVSFHIIKPNPVMLRLWPTSAPNLKKMIIGTKTAFPPLFSGEMPLLHSMVTPVANHHQFLITQHLTSLTLYPPYTLETLLATLENTPMLWRLELRGIFELARGDLPRILLPHLEDLSLSDCYHPIIAFIEFPPHARITVSVPDHLESEVHSPTEVRIVGQGTGDSHQCHVYIDLEKGSSLDHRHGVCVYAMGMVRNMTSVSSLRFNVEATFPTKCTTLFKRFRSLKVLTLSGPFICQILLDLVSAEIDVVPSLESLVLDQKFMLTYRKLKDWLISREQVGRKVAEHLIPIEVDESAGHGYQSSINSSTAQGCQIEGVIAYVRVIGRATAGATMEVKDRALLLVRRSRHSRGVANRLREEEKVKQNA